MNNKLYSIDNQLVRFALLTTEQNAWLDKNISRYDFVQWLSKTPENLDTFNYINRYFNLRVRHNTGGTAFSFHRGDELDLETELSNTLSEEIMKEIDAEIIKILMAKP